MPTYVYLCPGCDTPYEIELPNPSRRHEQVCAVTDCGADLGDPIIQDVQVCLRGPDWPGKDAKKYIHDAIDAQPAGPAPNSKDLTNLAKDLGPHRDDHYQRDINRPDPHDTGLQ